MSKNFKFFTKRSCACTRAKVKKYIMKEWISMCAKSSKLNPNKEAL